MTSRAAPIAFDTALATKIVDGLAATPGGLLPALWEMQAAFGHIPRPAIAILARGFNITEAEVFGVASFYHDFRLDRPRGKRVLKLCRAEACQAVGADALADYVKKKLGLEWGGTTPDGEWTLEPVFCLGLCASGPSAMIDEDVHARLDNGAVDRLVTR
ncbi:MAG TPA: NAD(P)H-dependent oxidoreductase subunit E [Rhizomicrobium sp.]|jgi:formate dehydrogenase subunit gamma|nr:NAD(P)H-dependent oxidoreductase subunit E [Rhizomicrobium sp.]